MPDLPKYSGNCRLTVEQLASLRNAVAEKLVNQHQIEPSDFDRGAIPPYESISEIILQKTKDWILSNTNITSKELSFFLTMSSYMCKRLLYETRRQSDLHFNFRKIGVATFNLFAHGKYDFEIIPVETNFFSKNRVITRTNKLKPDLSNTCLVELQSEIHLSDLKQHISEAKEEIKVLETFIENWLQLRQSIKSALLRKVRLRILVCHPESDITRVRNEDLNREFDPSVIENLLKNIYSDVEYWGLEEFLEIRLYSNLPGTQLYGIDDTYYSGWFWHQKAAIEGPFLKVESNNELSNSFSGLFESIWGSAQPYSKELYIHHSNGNTFHQLQEYIGNWIVYCNPGMVNGTINYPHGSVVVSELRISPERIGNGFATYYQAGHLRIQEMTGISEILANDSFIKVNLNSRDGTDHLHFVFHKGKKITNNLIGIFTSIYPEDTILGSGLAVLRKTPPGKFTIDNYILDLQNQELDEEEKAIARYLLSTEGKKMEPYKDIKEFLSHDMHKNPCMYSGVYRVYSHYKRRSENNSYINQGVLEIDPYYQVRHKRVHPHHNDQFLEATGYFEAQNLSKGQLVIKLNALRPQMPGRRGYFILNGPDRKPIPGFYLSGVFSGFSSAYNMALSRRILLEYVGSSGDLYEQERPQLLQFYSDATENLSPALINNLRGKTANLVGFTRRKRVFTHSDLEREGEEEVDFGKLFFDRGCILAIEQSEEISTIIKSLQRAYTHGFLPIDPFERKLEQWVNDSLITQEYSMKILANSSYLQLKDTIENFGDIEHRSHHD